MTTKSKAPAGGNGGREQCDAQSDATALPQYIDGCAIFKLPRTERRALLDRARENLEAAADSLVLDPLSDRCAACGSRLDRVPQHPLVRNAIGRLVSVHRECWHSLRTGWRP